MEISSDGTAASRLLLPSSFRRIALTSVRACKSGQSASGGQTKRARNSLPQEVMCEPFKIARPSTGSGTNPN